MYLPVSNLTTDEFLFLTLYFVQMYFAYTIIVL